MLFLILLLEGFITISVEILTMRQLLPFYGGSVVITSIIIGIFLLFLAMGYWRGGMYQRDIFKQLSRNFIFSMIWIGVGLSFMLITIYYYFTTFVTNVPLIASLILYLLLVLAPIVYSLGQTIPLTTNLFNQQHRVSSINGRALFLSTIGSFLGAILTSLLLFQFFGVAWTVVVNCILLLALITSMRRESHLSWWHIVLMLITLSFILLINVGAENILFKRTNNYGNYQVVETKTFGRMLKINQSDSSLVTADKKGFPYVELLRDILFTQLKLHHKQFLVIGAGGFSLTAAGTNENEVTYVDIDPDIKEIAERHLLRGPINGKFIPEDARSYLKKNQVKFDVILSDAFTHIATIPASLLTVEYFQEIANHLNPQGLMILNLISHPFFHDKFTQILFNTIHAVFPYCTIMPMHWNAPLANIIYICPKVVGKNQIYRDDLTTSTLDFFNSRDAR